MSSRKEAVIHSLRMLDSWLEAGLVDLTAEEIPYTPPEGLNDVKREILHMTQHLYNNIRILVGGEDLKRFVAPEDPTFEEAVKLYRSEKDHAYEIIANLKDADFDTMVGSGGKQMSKFDHIYRIMGHNLWTTGNLRYLRSMRQALLGIPWTDWKKNWGPKLKERREWFGNLIKNMPRD